ncbi:MAG: hypothetical protein UV02_C0014G0003 [Candidatus Kuenenbacteria bacterium GW2011_GWA2_42_15]|uniref:Peptidase M16 domain protein n=1 Tax=Candidatus Kuenenbacteria bacterium GW2011_GWA2_42_15 TaxID=1618677 RepID=A0A0G0Z0V9_9BACT|nr:MAG: hypothetical protein UV02_C0014G0003 [Candidatus Kuenenbacteria bacterium GW2011_GWA2_42_15]
MFSLISIFFYCIFTYMIVKVHKLKNGLTIIACEYFRFNSLYFDLAVKVGSRYENEKNNGIAHLVEHLAAAQSSAHKPVEQWIKDDLVHDFSAYTLQERTNFEFSAHKNDLKPVLKLLSELVYARGVVIDKRDLETEKKIILEELLENENEPDFYYNTKVRNICFSDCSLKLNILGISHNIMKFCLDDVRRFVNDYYRPENMILTVAGSFKIETLVKLADKYFKFSRESMAQRVESLKKERFRISSAYIEPKGGINFINRSASQNYLGYYATVQNSNADELIKREFFVEFLDQYLSHYLRAKIFCYSVGADINTFREFSSFSVESSFQPDKTENFYALFQQILKRFRKTLDFGTLKHLKNNKLKRLELDKDYPREAANLTSWFALVFGTEKIITHTYQQRMIKSVELKDIFNFYDQMFRVRPGTVIIGGKVSPTQKQQLKKLWSNWKV